MNNLSNQTVSNQPLRLQNTAIHVNSSVSTPNQEYANFLIEGTSLFIGAQNESDQTVPTKQDEFS
ncbi:21560_t:CDS:1, partial [Dentiscutata erythropus]